jgi:hypothetical protein
MLKRSFKQHIRREFIRRIGSFLPAIDIHGLVVQAGVYIERRVIANL